MANDAKSPDVSGEDALSVLQNMTSQGIPVDKVLESMEPTDVMKFLMGQYNLLNQHYQSLEEQLKQLKELVKDDEKDTSHRIERILTLMTSNMAYIKQMIQIEDINNEKLTEQEKINAKQELQFSGLMDRQNKFAISLANFDNNTKAILKELGKLKAKTIQHDQFNLRLVTIGSITIGVGAWLLTGDNLAKLIVALQQFLKFIS